MGLGLEFSTLAGLHVQLDGVIGKLLFQVELFLLATHEIHTYIYIYTRSNEMG